MCVRNSPVDILALRPALWSPSARVAHPALVNCMFLSGYLSEHHSHTSVMIRGSSYSVSGLGLELIAVYHALSAVMEHEFVVNHLVEANTILYKPAFAYSETYV